MSICGDISVDNATIFRSRRSLQTRCLMPFIFKISQEKRESGRELKTNPGNEIKVNIDGENKRKRIVEKQKLFLKDGSRESFLFFSCFIWQQFSSSLKRGVEIRNYWKWAEGRSSEKRFFYYLTDICCDDKICHFQNEIFSIPIGAFISLFCEMEEKRTNDKRRKWKKKYNWKSI